MFATGYNFSFPFLPSSMLPVSGNKANLYKYMFLPGLERPTLAVIGLVQPLGAIMPISEMQARWATRVFKGTSLLFYQTLAHLFNYPVSLSLALSCSHKHTSLFRRHLQFFKKIYQNDPTVSLVHLFCPEPYCISVGLSVSPTGLNTLPSMDCMLKDIKHKEETIAKRY